MRFLLFFFVAACVLIVNGQQGIVTRQFFQVDRNKPSVFLSFEKWGGAPARTETADFGSARISLRLHNNSTLPIAVDADGDFTQETLVPIKLSDGTKEMALPSGSYVELCYEAEAMPQKTFDEYTKIKIPQQNPSVYSCKWTTRRRSPEVVVWIQSGDSVVFSVPAMFFDDQFKLYTQFYYEWESAQGAIKAGEPNHRVYFYPVDLPNSIKKLIRESK
ncbi:MAG: hypothetical protein IPJ30_19150 [Acidobacteria bacterium]|nr:hypothetical protein [Acidobacteriota bacterium]MBK8148732.1 hypothetical protein [Acidobacteriota bacterium]